MSAFASGLTRLASGRFEGMCRLLDRDEPQAQCRAGLACNPDRPINQPACRPLAELGEKIDSLTIGIEPTRILPAGPHQDIGAGIKDGCNSVRLQIGTVADADFALDDRDAVEGLAAL